MTHSFGRTQGMVQAWPLAAAALLVVLFHLLELQRISPLSDFADNGEYMRLAQNLLSHRTYSDSGLVVDPAYYRPPEESRSMYPAGYPLLVAAVWGLFGHSILALKLANIFFLALSLPPMVLLLARLVQSERMALGLAFAWAILPYSTYMTGQVQSDIPFLAMLYWFLYLWQRREETGAGLDRAAWPGLAGLGALMFLVMTTRSAGIVLPPAVILFSAWRNRALPVAALAVCAIAALLVFAEGAILPRSGPGYLGIFAGMDAAGLAKSMLRNLQGTRWALAGMFDPQIPHAGFIGTGLSLALLALAAAGLWRLRRAPQMAMVFLLVYLPLILLFPDSSSWPRYLYPAIPVILGLSLAGLRQVPEKHAAQTRAAWALVAVVGLVSLTAWLRSPLLHRLEAGYPDAASNQALGWVRARTGPDDIVGSTFPYLTLFETGRPSLRVWPQQLRTLSDGPFVDRLRELKVRYLLVKASAQDPVIHGTGYDYSDSDSFGALVTRRPEAFELLDRNADFGFYRIRPREK